MASRTAKRSNKIIRRRLLLSGVLFTSLCQQMSAFSARSSPSQRCSHTWRRSSHMKMSTETDDEDTKKQNAPPRTEKALFGMGCFWNPQEEFNKIYGVVSATSGYASIDDDSNSKNMPAASYLSVCNGDGRTEAVLVEYDPSILPYQQLLQTFWRYHDASELTKPQYQSVIWPLTAEQRTVAETELEKARDAYQKQGMNAPVTVIANVPVTDDSNSFVDRAFTVAESIHQNFWTKFRLKVVALACATLFTTTDIPIVNNAVSDFSIKLVSLWVLWETAEMALTGARSLGMNPFAKGEET